jgi:hypothetical protein
MSVNLSFPFCSMLPLTHVSIGTQAVVHDIDYISKILDGEDRPVNCEFVWDSKLDAIDMWRL